MLRRRMRTMARELAAARERALEAERAEAFREAARRVAHELKNPLTPIRFAVEEMRDGRSFSTRRVHAIQHGKPILSMSASFQTPDHGMDHQDPMPDAPDPMSVPSLAELFADNARRLLDGEPLRNVVDTVDFY